MVVKVNHQEKARFNAIIQEMIAESANIGAHITIDASARAHYVKQIQFMSTQLRSQAQRGVISWAQAAEQAQLARNATMQIIRSRSSPVGLRLAQQIKQRGLTFDELIHKAIIKTTGVSRPLSQLTSNEQQRVYLSIIQSAGRSNPRVTVMMRRLSYAGRGLLVASIALSIYNILSSQHKWRTAAREVTVTGAGIGGGIAGGALAGLACGPGAPVCVSVGAFVGGALGAFGVNEMW